MVSARSRQGAGRSRSRRIDRPRRNREADQPSVSWLMRIRWTESAARSIATYLCALSLLLTACNKKKQEAQPDHPRLTPNVTMRDIVFRSAALNRDMQYRVVLPTVLAAGAKLPVVYLLHGGGGNF